MMVELGTTELPDDGLSMKPMYVSSPLALRPGVQGEAALACAGVSVAKVSHSASPTRLQSVRMRTARFYWRRSVHDAKVPAALWRSDGRQMRLRPNELRIQP